MTAVIGAPEDDSLFPLWAWAWLSPDLSENWHSVRSLFEVVPIDRIPTPANFDGGTPLVDASTMADYDRFPRLDHSLVQRATRRLSLNLPGLPVLGGRCVEGLLVLSGTTIPGLGFVPLGIASAQDVFDANKDIPDCRINDPQLGGSLSAESSFQYWFSPDHHGTEGNPHATIVIAVGTRNHGAGDASGVVLRHAGTPSSLDSSNSGFTPFAEGSKYSSASRTIEVSGPALPGLSWIEYRLKNESGVWHVFAADRTTEIPLPAVPDGMIDRAADAGMTVYAIRTTGNSLADLVSSSGDHHLNDLGDVIESFSRLTCLKKIPTDDPDYAKKCNPDAGFPDEACNPACEVK
jgi:hypothetical protein